LKCFNEEYLIKTLFLQKYLNMLQINYSSLLLEAGTDEAGRGCLAGPVTAAIILPMDFEMPFE
jgi:hypothetical protein